MSNNLHPVESASTNDTKQNRTKKKEHSLFVRILTAPFRPFRLTGFALKRLFSHPGLTFLALLGIILAVGLVANASLFAQAVDQVILDRALAEFSRKTGRPPFSTSVYTFPSTRAPISIKKAEELQTHVANTLSGEVGLPLKHQGIEVHSGNMMLQPPTDAVAYGEGDYLGSVNIVYVYNIADHMEIIAGDPLEEEAASGEVLEVWMHTRLAETMGVNVGEEYNMGVTLSAQQITIRVMGIWQAKDPTDPFWFENPDASLKSALIVRRQDYISAVEPMVASKTWYVAWHIILDESYILPSNARQYVEGFDRALVIINKYLPEARLNTPPLDPLEDFVQRGTTLSIILLGFNLPALGFLLYFLVLTSAIIAQWQRRESATLVSRGMRSSSILALTFTEEMLLFIPGYPLGIGFGMLLAILMGNTASFLTFTQREMLPVSLRGINIPLTILALLVALVARLWPASRASRLSVVEVDREHARPQRPPFWYRAYLDFLLLLPTYYAYRQLANRGTLALLVQDRPEDLYRDPLLVLVPALFILTAALMTLRVFPLIMRALDMIASVTPWITPHLALRQLGRQSQRYINPLLLVIVSLALGVYTISMAASLDQWLIDRMYYRVGADISFTPSPESPGGDSGGMGGGGGSAIFGGDWIPTPQEFLQIPGVLGATRVGNYARAEMYLTARDKVRCRYIAIDRLTYPEVAWFREDFAKEPLGGLMNRLALTSEAILVPDGFLEENHLQIGDQVPMLVVIDYDLKIRSIFVIAGTYKYFPTVYDQDEIVIIGNLDYLTFFLGVTAPHDILLRVKDSADGKEVLKSVQGNLGIPSIVHDQDARAMINEEQSKFERVGVFGTLTVGFLAAVVMAAMGLLIYTYASLRERLQRFTILRAIGLLHRQIMGQVVMEYTFLTAYGAAAGAIIGIAASMLFVPFFRVTGGESGVVPLPPLIPVIARDRVEQVAIVFVSIIIVMEATVIMRAISQRRFSMLKGPW